MLHLFKKGKAKPKAFRPGNAGHKAKVRQMAANRRAKKHEKAKTAEQAKIHRARIRGAGKRKIMRWAAVIAFILMTVGIVNAYRHNGMIFQLKDQVQALAQQDGQEAKQRHPATGPGAQHFARKFMKVYTNVKPGDASQKDRQDKLADYLASGLDKNAGIDVRSLNGERVYKASTVLDVAPAGKQTADVYMKITYDYKYQKQETKKVKKGKKKKKVKKLVDHIKQDLVDYKVIRLYADQNGYAVVELPRPFVPDNTTTVRVRNDNQDQPTKNAETQDVRDFLTDFFDAYTSDDDGNLKYYFVHASEARSIQRQKDFHDLKDVKVYDGQDQDQYRVQTTVVFKDPETGIISNVNYAFVLRKDKDKYQIQSLSSLHYNIQ